MTPERHEQPGAGIDAFGLNALSEGLATASDRVAMRFEGAPRIVGSGKLPHAGQAGSYELPAASNRAGRRELLRLRTEGSTQPTRVERTPVMPHPDLVRAHRLGVTSIGVGTDQTDRARAVLSSFNSYGSMIKALIDTNATHPSVIESNHVTWIPSSLFLSTLAREYDREAPPILAISKVRDRLHSILSILGDNLRRQLRRERRLVPVGLVQGVDTRCIEWLARQPGGDLPERAGPKQEILAVVRESTVDTYENRVLKLCLQLIEQNVRDYVAAYEKRFGNHTQLKDLKAFGQVARSLLNLPEISGLPTPSDTSKPNYVLQYGKFYRDIWWAYEVLRRQKLQQDEIWRWRHRICGEMVAVDFVLAASGLGGVETLTEDREVGIRQDPLAGHWVHFGSAFPSQVIFRDGIRFEIALLLPLHALHAHPNQVPADVELVVRIPERGVSTKLLIVAVASGLEAIMKDQSGSALRLVLQPGETSVLRCAGFEGLPSQSVCTFWPPHPADRKAAAQEILEHLLSQVAAGECHEVS